MADGKLAIYSINGIIKDREYVSILEISEHTGRGAANLAKYANEGYFGSPRQRGGVTVYPSALVNQCIINGMSQSQRDAIKSGAVKLITK